MNTPTFALAWELWRRHRQRWMLIVGVLLFFCLVYPRLCAAVGFNPDSPDASDELGRMLAAITGTQTLFHVGRVMLVLYLAGGPMVAMLLSLVCVLWIFSYTEVDTKTKDFLVFSTRIFTLPVSTAWLFWRLVLGGSAAVLGICAAWHYCVHMPRLEISGASQDVFGWLTLLALTQGITWAFAAWPVTRMLALMMMIFFFLFFALPERQMSAGSPLILTPLFALGLALARAGLEKMRRGHWREWGWSWPFAHWPARDGLRWPRRFASPAQAQLWFELRRSAASPCLISCCCTTGLALAALVIHALRAAAGHGALSSETMGILSLVLVATPLIVFGLHGVSPARSDYSFLMNRPLTSGELVIPMMKSAAVGAVLSWLAVLAALGIMPLLGDFHAVEAIVSPVPGPRAALVIGMVFLTWRAAVINYCFVLGGHRWLCQAPALLMLVVWIGACMTFVMAQGGVRFDWFWNHIVEWMASLLAVKLLLACGVFRTALKRRLLAPSAVSGCLVVWSALVSVLIATMLLLARPGPALVLPACLGVVLMAPLARVSLAPFAMAWARHTAAGSAGALPGL